MATGSASSDDVPARVAISFTSRRPTATVACNAVIARDVRGARKRKHAAVLTSTKRVVKAEVPVLFSSGDCGAATAYSSHRRSNLADLRGSVDEKTAAASTWGNAKVNTAVGGAPSATPRRFRPQQPPPLGGIVRVVHLPAGASGAAASALLHRQGRESTDAMRLGIRQPRPCWRLAVP